MYASSTYDMIDMKVFFDYLFFSVGKSDTKMLMRFPLLIYYFFHYKLYYNLSWTKWTSKFLVVLFFW